MLQDTSVARIDSLKKEGVSGKKVQHAKMGDFMAESQVFDTYRALWAEKYGVPCALILSPLDFGKLGTHLRETGITVKQMTDALEGYFDTDNYLVIKRRHPLGLFLVQPMQYLPAVERPRYVTPCPHTPTCSATWSCCKKQDEALA
jgi:hypothetical protein